MQTIVNTEHPTQPLGRELSRLCITDFASLPEGTIIDQAKLAEILGVTTRTVRRMVSRHEIPPAVSYSGHKVWLVGKLQQHLADRLRAAEISAEKSRKRIEIALNN